MAGPHHEVGIEQFRVLATEWSRFRRLVGQGAAAASASAESQLAAQVAISQGRGTWELAVAAAAYSVLRAPALTEGRPETDLTVVVGALESLTGRAKLPAFGDVVSEVTTLPMNTLLRQAPRLSSILRRAAPLTAASMACTAFCLSQHPNDAAAFLRCMREC